MSHAKAWTTSRYEYFSREPRHEVIWLRHPECARLKHSTPGVRCGRTPNTFPCSPQSPVLKFMASCWPFSHSEFSPRVRSSLGGRSLDRYNPDSPCSSSPCFPSFRNDLVERTPILLCFCSSPLRCPRCEIFQRLGRHTKEHFRRRPFSKSPHSNLLQAA